MENARSSRSVFPLELENTGPVKLAGKAMLTDAQSV